MKFISSDEHIHMLFGLMKKMERKIDRLELLLCDVLNEGREGKQYEPDSKNTLAYPDGSLKKAKKQAQEKRKPKERTLFDDLYKGAYPNIDDDEIPF